MKTPARWTIADYHRIVAAGILHDRRVELLAGEILEMPPEGSFHAFYSETLADYLRSRLTGKALVREARPVTSNDSEPEPDISVVQLPRERYRDRHPSAADIFWVVEVSDSSLLLDLNLKRPVYAKAGIPEYWVVSLKKRTVSIFRQLEGDDYSIRQDLNEGSVSPLAFPALEIPFGQFFE